MEVKVVSLHLGYSEPVGKPAGRPPDCAKLGKLGRAVCRIAHRPIYALTDVARIDTVTRVQYRRIRILMLFRDARMHH